MGPWIECDCWGVRWKPELTEESKESNYKGKHYAVYYFILTTFNLVCRNKFVKVYICWKDTVEFFLRLTEFLQEIEQFLASKFL